MIRKSVIFLLVLAMFLILVFPLVSAQLLPPVKGVIQGSINALEDILGPLFAALLNTTELDDFLFAKILVVFLLYIIIFTALKRVEFFERVRSVAVLVAMIISLLAVRYISDEGFFAGILLPYGALGIAIVSFLPFLIYFWFVHQAVPGSFGRRIAWILYGIIFLLLWVTRPAGEISQSSNWIYFFGLLAVAISLIFDRTVHGYFGMSSIRRLRRNLDTAQIARLQAELAHLANAPDTPEIRSRRRDIIHELKRLHGI